MPRIGAEYYWPDDEDSQVTTTARLVFLARVEDVAPEVVDHLREKVLPLYQEARDNGMTWPRRASWERSPSFWRRLPKVAERHPDERGYQALMPLYDVLTSWADTYHLTDEWLLEDALHTLYAWTEWPRLLEVVPERFHPGGAGSMVPEMDPPTLEVGPWDPTIETWAGFQDRARETFERWLRDYRTAGDAWADDLGLESAPEKRPRKGDPLALHWEWVARYQCQGWSYAQIAEHYDKGTKNPSGHSGARNVSRTVRDLADLMGLTLRAPDPN